MRNVRSWMGCLVAVAALSVVCGCSQAEVRIDCAPRINTLEHGDGSPGSAMTVVLVTLTEDSFRRLNQSKRLRGHFSEKENDDPSGSITAYLWFHDGLDVEVTARLTTEAITKVTVGPGSQVSVPILRSGGMFGRGGILALARFSGMEKNDKKFQAEAWLPRGGQGNAVLKVGKTSIRWE